MRVRLHFGVRRVDSKMKLKTITILVSCIAVISFSIIYLQNKRLENENTENVKRIGELEQRLKEQRDLAKQAEQDVERILIALPKSNGVVNAEKDELVFDYNIERVF